MRDDELLALHPLIQQMIRQGNRDRALTLNWAPAEPDAYDCFDLPALSNRNAMKARTQIITEALAAGDRFISYSRRKHFYARVQRYYHPTCTYHSIIPAVDQLAEAGIIEHEKVPPGHRGFQSRFRASQALLKEMAQVPVVYRPLEIIILRDAEGNPKDYRDNRETHQMRKQLAEFNEALAAQQIAIGDRIIREGDPLDNGARAQAQLHRVFNRSDFSLGGRFYGGHWQNIGAREHIKINGEATVELDYSGMHIRMLYAEAGLPMPADPYAIDGWPREQVKRALLIAINAPSHRKAVLALTDWLRSDDSISDRYKTADRLIRAVKAAHPRIAHAIASDAGIRLMRRDSEIAAQVMREVMQATGLVPLPIHDSFIVPVGHRTKLEDAMENAFPCDTAPKKSLVIPHPDLATCFPVADQRAIQNTTHNMERSGVCGSGVCGSGVCGSGGVGSSDLTEHVLGIVNAQLDELEARRNCK
jgi:hypothetical protein